MTTQQTQDVKSMWLNVGPPSTTLDQRYTNIDLFAGNGHA